MWFAGLTGGCGLLVCCILCLGYGHEIRFGLR